LRPGLPGKKERQRAIARNDSQCVNGLRHRENVAAPRRREQLLFKDGTSLFLPLAWG
jgi:hypothetical protein